jgi:hypothetical protein
VAVCVSSPASPNLVSEPSSEPISEPISEPSFPNLTTEPRPLLFFLSFLPFLLSFTKLRRKKRREEGEILPEKTPDHNHKLHFFLTPAKTLAIFLTPRFIPFV